jgi:hypothetical protein
VEGDDAEAIRQWGPLAFAVAAADRPELQGSPAPADAPPEMAEEPTGSGRRLGGILIVGVIVLALLAVGAFYGRTYLGF